MAISPRSKARHRTNNVTLAGKLSFCWNKVGNIDANGLAHLGQRTTLPERPSRDRHLVGDMVGLLDAFNVERAVICNNVYFSISAGHSV